MHQELLSLAAAHGTAILVALAVLARLSVLSSPKGSAPRARFRFAYSIFLIHLALLLSAAVLAFAPHIAGGAKVGAALTGTLSAVTLASVALFEGVVRRARPALPRIVPDLVTMIASFIGLMRTSSQLGFEISGVIATSAVLTAVIGLALQDTLGNALGGLALQLDSSVQVGDWVRINDVTGQVAEIHWRYTAIETNNWETVIVPNSVLMRSQVTVLGRRSGAPLQVRRNVSFQVDFRTSPSDVIQVIERALVAQPIPNVAREPPPNCVATSFGESQTKYTVRYWLTALNADESTDSLVRNRIFYALARARLSLAIPAQTLFVTEDDQERHAQKRAAEHARRMAALRHIDLFDELSEEEHNELAQRLTRAPFAAGETITREGAAAHHLYMIQSGDVSVRVGGLEAKHEVNRLHGNDFFGEMALLTGEPRRATCIAMTDVECYRLDAEAFRALLGKRPDMAERVAQVLAERETALVAAKERMNSQQAADLRAQRERALVGKIRAFFDLD